MFQQIIDNIDVQMSLFVAAIVGLLLVLEGLRQLLSRGSRSNEVRSKRMKLIEKGANTEELLSILKPKEKKTFVTRLPFVGDLPTVLLQAGITISSGTFLLTCLAAAFAVGIVFSQIMNPASAILVAVLMCLVVPVLAVRLQRTQRINHLVRQLPDALEMMARGLKVGHPLNASLAAVANEMPDPIATEFGIIVDQVSFGDDLTDAVSEFADRLDQEDIHYLSTAISIQHGTGGDLARILSTLAKVIRDRMTMRRKIKAVSAEGRMSASILSVVPVILFTGLNIMSPRYYGDIADEPLAKPIVFVVVVLVLMNAAILRKLVTFRF